MHHITDIVENNEHYHFWAASARLFRFRHIFGSPFRRLMTCLHVSYTHVSSPVMTHSMNVICKNWSNPRYLFWRKISSTKIEWTDSRDVNFLKLIWRFSSRISFTLSIFESVLEVESYPGQGTSSMISRPFLNTLYYS